MSQTMKNSVVFSKHWLRPVPTLWTQPPHCLETTTRFAQVISGSETQYYYGQGWGFNNDGVPWNPDYQECWPLVLGESLVAEYNTVSGTPVITEDTYYSPALYPSGWTGKPTQYWSTLFPQSTGTAVMCCPPHLWQHSFNGAGYSCYQGLVSGAVMTSVWDIPSWSLPPGIVTAFQSSDSSSLLASVTLTNLGNLNMFQQPMWVSFDPSDTYHVQNFQSQAQDSFTVGVAPTSSQVLSSGSQLSSSGTSSQPSKTSSSSGAVGTGGTGPTSTPQTGRSGLSPGARAGIAVAIIFVVIAIVLVIFIYFRRRRQAKANNLEKSGNAHELATKENTHELGFSSFRRRRDKNVDESRNAQELITKANTHEMEAKHTVSELKDEEAVLSLEVTLASSKDNDNVSELDATSHVPKRPQMEATEDENKLRPRKDNGNASELDGVPVREILPTEDTENGKQLAPHMPNTSEVTGGDDSVISPKPIEIQEPKQPPQVLESQEIPDTAEEPIASEPLVMNTGESSDNMEASGKEEKLKQLRERMEVIRVERERLERLERLQELKDMEEATRKEILETERREGR